MEQVKRMVWKLSDVQVKLMFDFYSSSQVIQNVAYGTIKGSMTTVLELDGAK